SKVVTGAPSNTAATPPTTMCSTPAAANARSSSRKFAGDSGIAEHPNRIDLRLQHKKSFERRQGQHPANERDVDAVRGGRVRTTPRLGVVIASAIGVDQSLIAVEKGSAASPVRPRFRRTAGTLRNR